MRIEQIELIRLNLPRLAAYESGLGRQVARETVLVRILADGVTGWGEYSGDGPRYSYETVATAWHVLRDHLAPLALARPMADPRELPALFARVRGHPFAKAALEAAIWDVAARMAGCSLSQHIAALTGHRVSPTVAIGVSIGVHADPAKAVARAIELSAHRPARIKLKIRPGCDIDHARAIRRALPSMPLMVDANGSYTDPADPVFRSLDDLDLLMLEQPLAGEDLLGHAALQASLRASVCLDESITSPAMARLALHVGACRVINIKQGRMGGLSEAIALHDLCRASGVPVWCGGMFETGIGRALNAALASLPGFSLPADAAPAERIYGFDLVTPPLEYDGSALRVPSRPGIGVEVNVAGLAPLVGERLTLSVP